MNDFQENQLLKRIEDLEKENKRLREIEIKYNILQESLLKKNTSSPVTYYNVDLNKLENYSIATENLIKDLTKQIPGVVYQYRYHPDGRNYFPYSSENIYDIYEVHPEDVVEDAALVLSRLHPDDYNSVIEKIVHSYNTLKIWEDDYRVVLPSKGERWLRGIAKPVKLDDGSVLWHGFIQDITQRKLLEQKIQESENLFRSIFNYHSAIMLLIETDSGRIVDSNNAALKFYGYSKEEFSKLRITDLNILSKDEVFKLMKQAEQTKTNQFIFPHRLKNGTIKQIEVFSTPIQIENKTLMFSIIFDITEKIENETKLKNSEAKFKIMFEDSPDAFFIMDLVDGKILDCNNAATRMLKGTKEEIINFTPAHFSPEFQPNGKLSSEFVQEKIIEALQNNFVDFEWVHKRIDKTEFWAHVTISLINYESSQALFVSWRDITDSKNASLKIAESEAMLNALLQNSTDAIGVHENGIWKMCNPATLKLFKLNSQEELIGKRIFNIIAEEEKGRMIDLVKQRLKENKEINYYVTKGLRKDGETFDLEVTTAEININGKKIVFGILRDISERLYYERALKESEERWKFAIDGSGDGLWDWDAITNQVYFSPQWKKLLGYENDEIGTDLSEWENRIHPEDKEKCFQDIAKHINGESSFYLNVYRLLCKDQTYKWILDRGIIVEWTKEGKPKRLIGTHRDITDEKNFQIELNLLVDEVLASKKLIESEIELKNSFINELESTKLKLEQTINEKDKFFSIIAHDLRSPFNGFLGLTRLLNDKNADLDIDEIKEFTHSLNQSAETLYKLLDNLLNWAKVQRNILDFKPQEISLIELVNESLIELNSRIESKNQIINFNSSENTYAYADRNMVKSIIRNLISNANKFTRDNGFISINISKINDIIEVCIEDNGIGIPEDKINTLFNLNSKISRKGTNNEPSSGLGLILVKEFIEKNNGKIWVESKEGKGSKFTFSLPILENNNKF